MCEWSICASLCGGIHEKSQVGLVDLSCFLSKMLFKDGCCKGLQLEDRSSNIVEQFQGLITLDLAKG